LRYFYSYRRYSSTLFAARKVTANLENNWGRLSFNDINKLKRAPVFFSLMTDFLPLHPWTKVMWDLKIFHTMAIIYRPTLLCLQFSCRKL